MRREDFTTKATGELVLNGNGMLAFVPRRCRRSCGSRAIC